MSTRDSSKGIAYETSSRFLTPQKSRTTRSSPFTNPHITKAIVPYKRHSSRSNNLFMKPTETIRNNYHLIRLVSERRTAQIKMLENNTNEAYLLNLLTVYGLTSV